MSRGVFFLVNEESGRERKKQREKERDTGRKDEERHGGRTGKKKERKKFGAQNHGPHFFPARVPSWE